MKVIKAVGGLGSQMMAYALFLALKERYEGKVIFDVGWFRNHKQHNGLELTRVFGIEIEENKNVISAIVNSKSLICRLVKKLFLNKRTIFAEKYNFNYIPDVFKNEKLMILDQCWTSYLYFDFIEKRIVDQFSFPDFSDSKNQLLAEKILVSNSVSLHVRRGDYLCSESLGGVVGLAYYKKAVQYIRDNVSNPIFYVFSDDIAWCKSNLNLATDEVIYVDWNCGDMSYQDMHLMSICKHNIIANSSFSWWGAYLNRNETKIVICPNRWGNIDSNVELKDMNKPDWIKMES
ncbi:Alpha-1,2-fucosyltransferase [Vibrio cholerae]|nr:putative glycosyltransferase [Vibrio cholerae]GHW30905.1 Alpha-1,2-fucosyltransferase [Vibrio cholerae]